MPPANPAHPQGRMVPDCSRSGLVAPAARTSCLDPNGVPRRTPLASMGQAKFRALAQPGKNTVSEVGLKEQGSPQAWGGRRGPEPGKQLTLECAPQSGKGVGRGGGS